MLKSAVFVSACLWVSGALLDTSLAKTAVIASKESVAEALAVKKLTAEAPAVKKLTAEEITAQKIDAKVAELKQQCAKEKLDLLNTFINDLRSIEEFRKKYEDVRDREIKKQP